MLKYTFSKREKILMVILAVIVVVLVWYMLVFQNANNQITSLNKQISTVNEQLTIDQAKISSMNTMQKYIDKRKAAGATAAVIPKYDNTQALMVELNSILSPTENYNLKFDAVAMGSSGYMERGVTMNFGCDSYEAAESVLTSLENGAYPCRIDTVSITENTGTSTSYANVGTGSSKVASTSKYAATTHVTFYEKAS